MFSCWNLRITLLIWPSFTLGTILMTIPESSSKNIYPCFPYTLRKLSKSIMPVLFLPDKVEIFLDSSTKAIGTTPKFFKIWTLTMTVREGSGITKGKIGRKQFKYLRETEISTLKIVWNMQPSYLVYTA